MEENKCSWLTLLPGFMVGAEDDPDDDKSGDDDKPEDKDDDDKGEKPEKSDKSDDEEDTTALKTALARERANVKAREKELAKLRKKDDDAELAKKDEVEQATIKAQRAEEKAQKAAKGLLKREINSAIEKAAVELGFIDTDDAIAGVDWSDLEYEQDEDDPSEITLNSEKLKKAVKAVATKKPHFIKSGTDDGEPTGSNFGGGKKKKTSEDTYRDKYPSLSR